MLRALERDGLVAAEPSVDRRTKRLTLTAAGRKEMAELDRISEDMAAATLAPLTIEQRARLLQAQAEVRRLLAISMVSIAPEDPGSPDARWCLGHYFAELAERFEEPFEPAKTLPTGPDDLFLLARFVGQPAGCGVLKALDESTGELLRMWVDRPHRGLGIAGRLLDELERHASARGHAAVRLYTNRSLDEAKAMYRSRGYEEIPCYNDDPYANHWFEKRLSASNTERA
jgi:ribosomal protein S18 acetylase RimI-like enzyme